MAMADPVAEQLRQSVETWRRAVDRRKAVSQLSGDNRIILDAPR